MGKLDRDGRVIVAEGGSCPSLERLSNGGETWERDIEGVFYVERDEEPAWRGDVG